MKKIQACEPAYYLICNNMMGPDDEVPMMGVIAGQGVINYVEQGLTEEQALQAEVAAYQESSYKNATALFCAFQLVHTHFLKNRKVRPEDTQQRMSE